MERDEDEVKVKVESINRVTFNFRSSNELTNERTHRVVLIKTNNTRSTSSTLASCPSTPPVASPPRLNSTPPRHRSNSQTSLAPSSNSTSVPENPLINTLSPALTPLASAPTLFTVPVGLLPGPGAAAAGDDNPPWFDSASSATAGRDRPWLALGPRACPRER